MREESWASAHLNSQLTFLCFLVSQLILFIQNKSKAQANKCIK